MSGGSMPKDAESAPSRRNVSAAAIDDGLAAATAVAGRDPLEAVLALIHPVVACVREQIENGRTTCVNSSSAIPPNRTGAKASHSRVASKTASRPCLDYFPCSANWWRRYSGARLGGQAVSPQAPTCFPLLVGGWAVGGGEGGVEVGDEVVC